MSNKKVNPSNKILKQALVLSWGSGQIPIDKDEDGNVILPMSKEAVKIDELEVSLKDLAGNRDFQIFSPALFESILRYLDESMIEEKEYSNIIDEGVSTNKMLQARQGILQSAQKANPNELQSFQNKIMEKNK